MTLRNNFGCRINRDGMSEFSLKVYRNYAMIWSNGETFLELEDLKSLAEFLNNTIAEIEKDTENGT